MNILCEWNGNQSIIAHVNGCRVSVDSSSPFGEERRPVQKAFSLVILCGYSALKIVESLVGINQKPAKFFIRVTATTLSAYPHSFSNISLNYMLDGYCSHLKVVEAVLNSQPSYSDVYSILPGGTDVDFSVTLNGANIYSGVNHLRSGLNDLGIRFTKRRRLMQEQAISDGVTHSL